ncbi:MAG: thiamine pyrophosphate-binding protein [Promethearchaeota archaeon]
MQLTGSEIIVDYLVKEGVPYAVGIPGHGCLGFTDALLERADQIKVIQVKQEMSAVHLAVGFYRVTGIPLVVFTSIGPGAVNSAIGLADAYVDSMPVLVITGDTHVHMRGKGVLQEIERAHDSSFPRILEPVTKRSWQLSGVEQVPAAIRRAFNVMLTGRRGPVHLDLPMDIQCDAADVDVPEPASHRPGGVVQGDPAQVERAVDLLASAKRPVMLLGGGVVAAGAFDEVRRLAEALGAAVVTTMMAKDAFPNDHPLFAWHAGSKGTTCGLSLTRSADVLLAVGTRFADETACSYREGASFSSATKIVHVDVDPSEIGKNYPVEVGVVGDARAVLGAILERLSARGLAGGEANVRKTPYYEEVQRLKAEWFEFLAKQRDPSIEPVTISAALKEIREFLDRDAVVVTSSGNVQAQMLQEFPFYVPRTCVTAGGFSTMGYTLPAAIGAKLGATHLGTPDRQVVGLVGDGDFLMTCAELHTAVQLGVPVVIVVFNNAAWMAITDLQRVAYGVDRAYATEFKDPDGKPCTPNFKALAEAFGCHGGRASKAAEVKPALEAAFASGRPAVVELLVNREYPMTGSPAVGWWDVPVPAYLKERRANYEAERSEERL